VIGRIKRLCQRLPPMLWVFVGAFVATSAFLAGARHLDAVGGTNGAKPVARAAVVAISRSESAVSAASADRALNPQQVLAEVPPSPPEFDREQLAVLTETAITAEDSEQRSLAIEELSQAPAREALPAMARIFRENNDHRSRISAINAVLAAGSDATVRDAAMRILGDVAGGTDTSVTAHARDAWSQLAAARATSPRKLVEP
jgi:hypothetical protein